MVTDADPLSERRPSGEVGESYRSGQSTRRKNARTASSYMAADERGLTPTASNLWWFNCPVALRSITERFSNCQARTGHRLVPGGSRRDTSSRLPPIR